MQIEQKEGKRYGAKFSWRILLFDTPLAVPVWDGFVIGVPMYVSNKRKN